MKCVTLMCGKCSVMLFSPGGNQADCDGTLHHRVEYFGQKLDGFAFTTGGWVQSYGSRYGAHLCSCSCKCAFICKRMSDQRSDV